MVISFDGNEELLSYKNQIGDVSFINSDWMRVYITDYNAAIKNNIFPLSDVNLIEKNKTFQKLEGFFL